LAAGVVSLDRVTGVRRQGVERGLDRSDLRHHPRSPYVEGDPFRRVFGELARPDLPADDERRLGPELAEKLDERSARGDDAQRDDPLAPDKDGTDEIAVVLGVHQPV
jgi:hypothetical protein